MEIDGTVISNCKAVSIDWRHASQAGMLTKGFAVAREEVAAGLDL